MPVMPVRFDRFDRTELISDAAAPPLLLTAGCPPLLSSKAASSAALPANVVNGADDTDFSYDLDGTDGGAKIMAAEPSEPPKDTPAQTACFPASSPRRRCLKCQTISGIRRREKHCPQCRLAMRLVQLLAESRLLPAAWHALRSVFGLPEVPTKTPPDQARAALQSLESFVKRVPFDEQCGLTGTELRERMVAQPNFPARFAEAAHRKDRTPNDYGDGAAANGEANAAAQPRRHRAGGASDEPTDAQQESAAAAKRQPISAARFTEVAVRQGSYCYWCGIRVIRESLIPPANRMLKKGATILYYVGDELREEALGTIDHLLRISDGGDNSPANLVISCLRCNQERERITIAYGHPFARRRVLCRSCGRFFHPDWGCCSICGALPERTGTISQLMNYFYESASELIRAVRRYFV